VATRWPHRVAEVIDPRLPDAMDVPWATMAVTVPIPDEGELLFISASTSWRLEAESARERQAVALRNLMPAIGSSPDDHRRRLQRNTRRRQYPLPHRSSVTRWP